ncbi:TetR/AcrR family transcriptional regulator [Laceyella putida]|uniref:TetR/AcrR family transcriptional regulator n=1 Tax=Laceyella putida TaxID=110101 RepID=A0ABW2RFR3_9BACL
MPRKRTAREQQAMERRQQLLKAAKQLFAENGYHATTTKSINEKIGMADGLLYHYFPQGKRQMLQELVREEVKHKVDAMMNELRRLDRELDLEQTLLRIGKALMRYTLMDREIIIIYLKEHSLLEPELVKEVIGQILHLSQEITLIIQRRFDSEAFKELDPVMMSRQYVSGISNYLAQELYFGSDNVYRMPAEEYLVQWVKHTISSWKK